MFFYSITFSIDNQEKTRKKRWGKLLTNTAPCDIVPEYDRVPLLQEEPNSSAVRAITLPDRPPGVVRLDTGKNTQGGK
jgi:hypothetical protein